MWNARLPPRVSHDHPSRPFDPLVAGHKPPHAAYKTTESKGKKRRSRRFQKHAYLRTTAREPITSAASAARLGDQGKPSGPNNLPLATNLALGVSRAKVDPPKPASTLGFRLGTPLDPHLPRVHGPISGGPWTQVRGPRLAYRGWSVPRSRSVDGTCARISARAVLLVIIG